MRCTYACGTADHALSRRVVRGRTWRRSAAARRRHWAASAPATPAIADQLKAKHKRVLNIFLHGGVSQLETWDPKPNTDTGGPFRAIPTSVPGMHICELLPHTAKQMHHLALVRSLNTKNDDHGKGTGRNDHRPQADAGHRVSAPRRGRRQGADARAISRCRATSSFAAAAPGNRRGGLPRARSTPASCWTTASRRRTPSGPPRLTAEADDRRNAFRAAGQRPLRRPPPHGRDRRLHVLLRPGPAAHGPPRGVRRDQGAGRRSRPLRQARIRPALPARPPAAGSGRAVRAGEPLELRHALRELRFPHRAARRVRPAVRDARRRPGRPRPA